ncbi:hypothetical protein GmHk_02G004778 [Glycine max]|nr:hypothetical protein GmHk_02G004778 [Glycine max]
MLGHNYIQLDGHNCIQLDRLIEDSTRILKLVKYKLKAQVEKDEGPEAKALPKLLIVAECPN